MSDDIFLPFPKNAGATPTSSVLPGASQARATVAQTPATPQSPHEQSPEYTRLELPSNYVPYTFKDVYAGTIRGIHQAKFAKAHKLRQARLVVETVNSLMRGASAFDLTPSDFRWLMYYLRKTNYVKTPLLVTAFCTNETHLSAVAEGRLQPSTLENAGTLNSSMLEEKALDVNRLAERAENPALIDLRLGFPTMQDTLLAVEKDDEEFTWLAELAMCLASTDREGKSISLEDRVKIVAQMSPDQTEALAAYAEAASDYGISETIRMRCKECGAEILETFQPSAHMFL